MVRHKEEIIRLRKEENLSYREIQKRLGCSRSTIAYHLNSTSKANTRIRALRRKEKSNIEKKNHSLYIKRYVWRVKRLFGCKDCGEKDPRVLDFDHQDRALKYLSISNMVRSRSGIKTLKEEMKKCEVRCANCHRIKTSKEMNWYNFD